MKKVLAALFLTGVLVSSCHYGQEEAQKTLDANQEYKSDKMDYSTNRGNDGVMPEQKKAESAPAAAPSDSTVKK